ncbi:MAG: tetratricopeptide repeat protein [Nocardioidaceae bacterium]|nr:tetratricopeptide repeat protein [Nocardioidaceae bacterium]
MDESLLTSLEAAVAANPDDVALRLHVADLLLAAGRSADAIRHAATALAHDPDSEAARALMTRAMGTAPPAAPTPPTPPPRPPAPGGGFDWQQAEEELDGVVPPMFVDGSDEGTAVSPYDVEPTGIRLADVGGMTEVKKRLDASFLAPLRNPELRTLYKKSLRGGLLLYGPPGCGKTFLARAVAGELEARFLSVSLADVLDMYIGNSEKNVKELFEIARASAPCVLFLDELDAIGQKRTMTRNTGMRTTVNQLLTELDGIGSSNEGVYVLGATNHPWDVDPALRRPGRLDRTLLVLPPDQSAREAILRYHLRDRPVANIDVRKLAKRTEGYSGADLAHLCDTASEHALMDSASSGQARMIGMPDLDAALAEVRPSIGPWMETARNVALFANQSGEYDELAKYLRKRGLS